MTLLEQASAALHQAGKRMTDQRRLIITTLEAANDHLDAEALYHLVHEHDPSISLATVYRTLNTLEEAGILQQRYLARDHERKYFEIQAGPKEYHFTCNACGRPIHFRSPLIAQLKDELEAQLGVAIHNICCCVDGLCPDCRARSKHRAG